MNPRVKGVEALADHWIELHFDNGEIRRFNTGPYLEKGIFRELKNTMYFKKVQPFMGTIQWPNGQDFCPDSLYECSEALSSTSC